jgi:hypothetical protein
MVGEGLTSADLASIDPNLLKRARPDQITGLDFATLEDYFPGVCRAWSQRDPVAMAAATAASMLDDGAAQATMSSIGIGGFDTLLVTPENAADVSACIVDMELHRYDKVLAAIAAGLTSVIPKVVLRALHWRDLRVNVCGKVEISEEALREAIQVHMPPPHEARFWECIKRMQHEDRSLFLYFATGQRRLPLKSPLRVQLKRKPTSTDLPTAATCFFAMTLPEDPSAAVMYERLLYAIRHCNAIDGDGQARDRVVMED